MSDEVENELPIGDFGAILGSSKERTKWVDIPEWGMRFKIKALTKAEQVRLRQTSTHRGVVDETKLEMNMLVYSLVEPRATFDVIDELYKTADSKGLNRLVAAAIAFSGLTENYIAEAEDNLKS